MLLEIHAGPHLPGNTSHSRNSNSMFAFTYFAPCLVYVTPKT
jgi:hypothetical protein